jgi:cardiolipin synthase
MENSLVKEKKARKIARAVVKSGYSKRNRVKIVKGGRQFFDVFVKLIGESKKSIHIQTYAFDDDETGRLVTNALIEAAARNVSIYILADGYASQKLSKAFLQELKEKGIHFRHFEPLLKSRNYYFGRRLHHKVAVFDEVRALVGSMNIADRYNDTAGEKSWLDMALYVEGEAALQLQVICWRLWLKSKRKMTPSKEAVDFAASIPEEEGVTVRVRRNDWVMRKIEISRSYYSLFGGAKDTIYIMCSYFLPGKHLLRQLKRAVRRGVKVYIVLAGTSDVKMAKFAERYLYRWILRNKMELYEYQPTVLHAKMSIADTEKITLGSYNLNGLSAHASIELNLDVTNKELGKNMEAQIKQIIANDCKKVDPDTYVRKIFTLRQFMFWASYQLLNFILTISTFYFKQQE